MTKLIGATALLLAAVASLCSQPTLRIFTNPRLPTREVLERLDLTIGWRAKLPTGGQRDGLFTLQLLPAKGKTQLVVQTVFGVVYLLDGETGDLLWRTEVGIPGWASQPVGYNDKNIFVTRRDLLYVLNRANGAQRLYTVAPDTKLPNYGYTLSAAPSAAPQADDLMLFVPLGNRVQAFLMPDWNAAESSITTYAGRELSPKERQALIEKTEALPPLLAWSYQDVGMHIEQPVLVSATDVTAVSTAGQVLTFDKVKKLPMSEFKTAGNVTAPAGQHGAMGYIGSVDSTLYALNMESQRLVWRFLASAPILVKPEVTDRDVFVTGARRGLYRVERGTGQAAWLNPQAERFLSTNQKFVYALDRTGLLLVLDYARGTTLAQYDMRDWTIPVPNELTDRFYLASQDGQILCLRNRGQKTPLTNKSFLVKAPPPAKKEQKKADEGDLEKQKEKEDVKDKGADKDKEKGEEKGKDAAWLRESNSRPVALLACQEESPRAALQPKVVDSCSLSPTLQERELCNRVTGGGRGGTPRRSFSADCSLFDNRTEP
jgi:outer membrane protein assembly factor BamB